MSYGPKEGACALLDIAGVTSMDNSDYRAAQRAWSSLSTEAKAAVLTRHAIMFGCFDPSTGGCVCLCCGKPDWTHRFGTH